MYLDCCFIHAQVFLYVLVFVLKDQNVISLLLPRDLKCFLQSGMHSHCTRVAAAFIHFFSSTKPCFKHSKIFISFKQMTLTDQTVSQTKSVKTHGQGCCFSLISLQTPQTTGTWHQLFWWHLEMMRSVLTSTHPYTHPQKYWLMLGACATDYFNGSTNSNSSKYTKCKHPWNTCMYTWQKVTPIKMC